jgi:hypothetical protein
MKEFATTNSMLAIPDPRFLAVGNNGTVTGYFPLYLTHIDSLTTHL